MGLVGECCRGKSNEIVNIMQWSIYNGPTNALVCIKTLVQMSHTKTSKIAPTCLSSDDHHQGVF
jgi:hypothetical protein